MAEQRAPRLELTWPNKDKFLLVPKAADGKPVWVGRDHPAAHEVRLSTVTGHVGQVGSDPHGDNLLFTGDSLDVLRILREVPEYAAHYRGKVKLVYIDPPFNTKQTFVHYDDWMEHSTWLSFMRDRLLLIKDLLAPDGSVWVHLDDAEVHRMRCLMDEVFGAQNFAATAIWEKTTSARNDATGFSTDQDYVLVYAKDVANFSPRKEAHTAAADAAYRNPDGDPRGSWREVDYKGPKNADERPNLYYPIRNPYTGVEVLPPRTAVWRYSQDRHEQNVKDGLVWWGRTGNYTYPKLKKFLTDRSAAGTPPRTLWTGEQCDTSRRAKAEVKRLFDGQVPFATPKPERLLQRVVHIGSNPGELVLDCFAGSGTTAAVAHKMGRRWVTVELSADNVAAFTAPRLAKVVDGTDPGGITDSVGWLGGGGFHTVVVEPSLYEVGPGGVVLLREGVSDDDLARAMCGQLGFTHTPQATPFAGRRGRMRLAVLDGFVGPEEARHLVSHLGDGERVTIAATAVLPGVEDLLTELARGSRVRKIPRDVLRDTVRRRSPATEGAVL